MHLPTPQFSRLITFLAIDLADSSLDSMILAWDHISTRYLDRLKSDRATADRIEAIRLLAVHDAVNSIFGRGPGFVFNESSTGTTITAAIAATAQASHDILASAFNSPDDLEDLKVSIAESLSLIADHRERAMGSATGAASAVAFIKSFGAESLNSRRETRSESSSISEFVRPAGHFPALSGTSGWLRAL